MSWTRLEPFHEYPTLLALLLPLLLISIDALAQTVIREDVVLPRDSSVSRVAKSDNTTTSGCEIQQCSTMFIGGTAWGIPWCVIDFTASTG